MTLIQLTPDVIYNPNTGGIIRRQAGGIDLDSFHPDTKRPVYVSDPTGDVWERFAGLCIKSPSWELYTAPGSQAETFNNWKDLNPSRTNTDPDFSPFSLAEIITAEIISSLWEHKVFSSVWNRIDADGQLWVYEEWRSTTQSVLDGAGITVGASMFLEGMDEE